MTRLYLRCGLCGRQQADGLLSRAHWGHTDAGHGSELRACPSCVQEHPDWEARLRASDGPGTLDVSTVPQVDGSTA